MESQTPAVFDKQLQELLAVMAREGASYALHGFSRMVGKTLVLAQPQVRLVPLADLPSILGGPEQEAVGIYLRTQGDIAGQIVLVLAYRKALELVDLLMSEAPGTAQDLGPLERSALGELGNLTGSFFLNAVAAYTGFGGRPSPPAVMVDMVGAIIDVIATTHGVGEHVLMLQVAFLSDTREAQADFCVIPDPAALAALGRRVLAHGQ